MIESFKDIEYFCATTDIWTRNNKSFIAVTVHYLEPETLHLKNKFIACEHFPGRHTHDRVAIKLKAILERFEILNRVYFITTDGAGEYVAAFTRFGNKDYKSFETEEIGELELESDDDGNDPESFVRALNENANESATDSNTDPEMFTMHDLPTNQLLANMNRIDCSAHKLEKLGKVDAKTAKGRDECYDQCHDRVFDKLESIWNLKNSRLSAELFTRITERKLIGPHRIRWLKKCEAVNIFFSF